MTTRRWIGAVLMAITATAAGESARGADDREEAERFRRDREATLKADDGWLTVVGLFWVKPGETKLGSDPASDILLPERAPGTVGTLELDGDGRATFAPAPGVAVTIAGKPFAGGEIHSDAGGRPADVLAVGDFRVILIKRGERFAVRLKDNASATRRDFAGLSWFPFDAGWVVRAKFVDEPSPTPFVFDTIVGEPDRHESPGYAEFERDGKTYRLRAVTEGDRLWFVFRDATSGRTTAGNARQLYADAPKGGAVTLDFNRAVNLPCAYIPFATCPIAPKENRLPVAVTAGERTYETKPGAGH